MQRNIENEVHQFGLVSLFNDISTFVSYLMPKLFLLAQISEAKPDDFYHLEYSENSLYLHYYTYNVSADTPFGLLQVYYVELKKQHWTSNWTFHSIH